MDAGADARLGRTFGKYTFERVIGAGGMSTVYQAKHRNGHRVAVKVLRPELSISDEVRRRFLREGYAANRVDHPGVVRILDDHTTEHGVVFLVLELLEGETIAAHASRAENGKLPLAFVVHVGLQLLEVLAAAHAAGVIHRDVKPENVLVRSDGTVKVLDFGIAQIRAPGEASVTATGRMLGTPAFMPPEQAYGRRREIDERSDIWSVGATLFTILAGRVVHDAPTAEETLVKAATEAGPELRSVAPEVPPAIAAVIDRALAREKDARWPTADAMRSALEAAAAEPVARAVASPRQRRRPALGLGAGIVAIAAGWLWWQPSPISTEEVPREPRATLDVNAMVPHDVPVERAVQPAAVEPPTIVRSRTSLVTVDASVRAGTVCGFDIDDEGRRWPKRCPDDR